uniref:Uncharacterized protein n=1 Tax=Ralstonia syzygii R24 TaxID=907261 RepID=G3ABF3_9RALS|nr:hypothetical protein RALSY_mp30158 [Ralstonia syzygii R24]
MRCLQNRFQLTIFDTHFFLWI